MALIVSIPHTANDHDADRTFKVVGAILMLFA